MKNFKRIVFGMLSATVLMTSFVTSSFSISALPYNNYIRGDIDGDEEVDVVDLVYLYSFLNGGCASLNNRMTERLDVDSNAIIDIKDYNLLLDIILGDEAEITNTYDDDDEGIPNQQAVTYKKYDGFMGYYCDEYTIENCNSIIEPYNEVSTCSVIGPDEREEYYNKGIVYINSHDSRTGLSYSGTGIVVGPNTILTAAHCVFDTVYNVPRDNVYFKAFNSNGVLEESGFAQYYHVPVPFIDQTVFNSENDYAIIKVANNLSSDRIMKVGVAREKLSHINTTVISSGYSGEDTSTNSAENEALRGLMVKGPGAISNMTQNVIYYDSDTVQGESGGPLYVVYDPETDHEEQVVIGINSASLTNRVTHEATINSATRISTKILHFIYNNGNL